MVRVGQLVSGEMGERLIGRKGPKHVWRSALWVAAATIGFALLGVTASMALGQGGYTPDSLSYMDIAINMAGGQGFSSQILFVGISPAEVPAPVNWWPPVYPATIRGLGGFGLPVDLAARVISVVAYVVVAILTVEVARRVFGRIAACLAVLGLVATPAFLNLSAYALSEGLAAASVVLATYFLVLYSQSRVERVWLLGLVGLSVGVASLTHYKALPFIPLFAVSVIVFDLRSLRIRERLLRGAVVGAVAGVPVAAWLARNLAETGSMAGSRVDTASVAVWEHAVTAVRTLVSDALQGAKNALILTEVYDLALPLIAVLVVLILAVLLIFRWQGKAMLYAAFRRWTPLEWLLLLIGLGYVAAMVASRTVLTQTDPLTTRQLLLSYPLLVVGGAAIASRLFAALGMHRKRVAWGALLLSAVVAGSLVRGHLDASESRGYLLEAQEEVLSVLDSVASPDWFIVGNSLYTVPWFQGLPVLTFSNYTYTQSKFDCRGIAGISDSLMDQYSVHLVFHRFEDSLTPEFLSTFGGGADRLSAESSDLGLVEVYRDDNLVAFLVPDGMGPVCDKLGL